MYTFNTFVFITKIKKEHSLFLGNQDKDKFNLYCVKHNNKELMDLRYERSWYISIHIKEGVNFINFYTKVLMHVWDI